MNNMFKGILLCTISGLAFGGQWTVAGTALKNIDPFYFTFIRYSIVSIFLIISLILTEGISKLKFEGHFLQLWFFGTMAFSLYNFLAFTGQKLLGENGAIISSIMMALIPIIALLVSWVYTNIKPTFITITSVIIAFWGVFLVISKGNISFSSFNYNQLFPIILMFLSVLAWVIYTIGGSKFYKWSSLRYTTLSCILGNISSLIIITFLTKIHIIELPTIQSILNLKWEFFYMSIIAGVIGVYTWNFGNLLLKPINGSLFINLVPIVTFIISIFYGYSISVTEIIGASLVIISLIINNINQRYLLIKTKQLHLINNKEG